MARVKLDDLPSEVKTRIVELCAEQDERFQEWTAAVKAMGAMKAELAEIRRSHGRSLGALFCTSKGWSEMAAPFLFTTLVASKSASMVFRCSVVFSRHQYFSKLVLDEVPTTTLDNLVPVLRSLANVREISIHHSFLSYGCSDARFLDYIPFLPFGGTLRDASMHALDYLVRRASTITLRFTTFSQIKAVVRRSEVLAKLHLALDLLANSATKLVEVLQLVPQIEDLGLSGSYETTVPTPNSLPACLPNLKCLTLTAPAIHPSFLQLAHLLADRLDYLRIEAPYDGEVDFYTVGDLSGAIFSRLKRIKLEGHDPYILPILEAMTPFAFPSLLRISFGTDGIGDVTNIHDSPLRVISAFDVQENHPLHLVEAFYTNYPPAPYEREFVDTWSSAHRVKITLDPYRLPDSTFLRGAFARGSEGALVERRRAVERTLEYLADCGRRARAVHVQGEQAAAGEYRRLARVLQAAELDRVAMAD